MTAMNTGKSFFIPNSCAIVLVALTTSLEDDWMTLKSQWEIWLKSFVPWTKVNLKKRKITISLARHNSPEIGFLRSETLQQSLLIGAPVLRWNKMKEGIDGNPRESGNRRSIFFALSERWKFGNILLFQKSFCAIHVWALTNALSILTLVYRS